MSKVRLIIDSQSAHAGKTIKLGDYQFVNGALELPGTQKQNEGIIHYLGKCYQARVEGGIDATMRPATHTRLVIDKDNINAGKTVKLGDYRFVDGVLVLPGSPAENDGIITYLGRCYQAKLEVPDGKCDTEADRAREVPSDVRPSREKHPKTPAGDDKGAGKPEADEGPELQAEGDNESLTERQRELRQILANLDPDDDRHWTKTGGASAPAIKLLIGETVSYNELKEAWPEFDRKFARDLDHE